MNVRHNLFYIRNTQRAIRNNEKAGAAALKWAKKEKKQCCIVATQHISAEEVTKGKRNLLYFVCGRKEKKVQIRSRRSIIVVVGYA